MREILKVSGLTVYFGGLAAIHDLSFSVEKGEIFAVIGPNGAGKTTLFNCVSRICRPTSGAIIFQGHDMLKVPPHRVARLGIARTFQNVELFPGMTVFEAVLVGHHTKIRSGILSEALGFPRARRQEKLAREKTLASLELLGLRPYQDRPASSLPLGAQKLVEFARALVVEPQMILLDEPVAGLNPHETEEIANVVIRLRKERDLTFVLVDHDMSFVTKVSDRVMAMNFGKLIVVDTAYEVKRHPDVLRAYLGEKRTRVNH